MGQEGGNASLENKNERKPKKDWIRITLKKC